LASHFLTMNQSIPHLTRTSRHLNTLALPSLPLLLLESCVYYFSCHSNLSRRDSVILPHGFPRFLKSWSW
jgi:hypothetical protein